MNHPISDALTSEQARTCVAAFLMTVQNHDAGGDTHKLFSDLLAVTELAEALAGATPDDSDWPHYGDVEPISGSREAAA